MYKNTILGIPTNVICNIVILNMIYRHLICIVAQKVVVHLMNVWRNVTVL